MTSSAQLSAAPGETSGQSIGSTVKALLLLDKLKSVAVDPGASTLAVFTILSVNGRVTAASPIVIVAKFRLDSLAVTANTAATGSGTGSSAVPVNSATSMAIVPPIPLLKDNSNVPSSVPALVGS